jgi:hypothetical protein
MTGSQIEDWEKNVAGASREKRHRDNLFDFMLTFLSIYRIQHNLTTIQVFCLPAGSFNEISLPGLHILQYPSPPPSCLKPKWAAPNGWGTK